MKDNYAKSQFEKAYNHYKAISPLTGEELLAEQNKMKNIYKYPLDINTDIQTLLLPVGAKPLSVVNQYDRPVLYALVDDSVTETIPFNVYLCMTGQEIELPVQYLFLGTIMLAGGTFVLHVFIEN